MKIGILRKTLCVVMSVFILAGMTTMTAICEDSLSPEVLMEISLGGAEGNQILWNAVSGADSYTLYVFTDGDDIDPANAIRVQENVSSGFALPMVARTGDLDIPLPHGEFFFRVQAESSSGVSAFSNAVSYIPGRRINNAQVHNLIEAFGGNYIIVDVRNLITTEVLAGHNMNAIFVPSNNGVNRSPDFEARILYELQAMPAYNGKDTLIFTYCQAGNRSRPSALFLAEQGYYAFDIGGWGSNNAQPGAPINVSVPDIFGEMSTRIPLAAPAIDFGEIDDGIISWPAVAGAASYEIFAFSKSYIEAQPFKSLSIFDPSNNTAFAEFHATSTAIVQPDGANALTFDISKGFSEPLPKGEFIFRIQAMAGDSDVYSNSALSSPSNATYIATLASAIPNAFVTKLNGNTNDLTITVTETLNNGNTITITKTFSISNNSAGIFQLGEYKVFVDTKGNTQIRACYFVD